MDAARAEIWLDAWRAEVWLDVPSQAQLDWLRRSGIDVMALIKPSILMATSGSRAPDGIFDYEPHGPKWLAFEEDDDAVFWQPRTGDLATYGGRVFALGQDIIDLPETYSFDCALNLFASPLQWLQAKRDGIVVIDWTSAFDRLRDVPRIAVAEGLLLQYRRHMRPRHMPELYVIPRSIAA